METPETERPLVTFAIIAYNQEKFIREAVEGAFAQTYEPLEIVLSDDCSTDRTFEIMQEMAANYNGPHKVILNRNEENRGIGGHVNRAMEVSKGEFIVVAAGDDISRPDRTTRLYEKVKDRLSEPVSIYSGCEFIDEEGRLTGSMEKPVRSLPDDNRDELCEGLSSGRIYGFCLGATHAWTRATWRLFGDLHPEVIAEDNCISLRNALVGSVHFLPDHLVQRRFHGKNVYAEVISPRSTADRMRTQLQGAVVYRGILLNFQQDLKTLSIKEDRVTRTQLTLLENALKREWRINEQRLRVLKSSGWTRLREAFRYCLLVRLSADSIALTIHALHPSAYDLYRRMRYSEHAQVRRV